MRATHLLLAACYLGRHVGQVAYCPLLLLGGILHLRMGHDQDVLAYAGLAPVLAAAEEIEWVGLARDAGAGDRAGLDLHHRVAHLRKPLKRLDALWDDARIALLKPDTTRFGSHGSGMARGRRGKGRRGRMSCGHRYLRW